MTSDAPADLRELAALEDAVGHRFADRSLLELALTHTSYANDRGDRIDNQRLEFLGDSVVGLVVAHLLYEAHPDWREGDLTRAMHALVDRASLAARAADLGLGDFLLLGRTERQSEGHTKPSILADGLEAVIGAIYLDAGLGPVEALARRVFETALAEGAPPAARDSKTALQEHLMAREAGLPQYRLVRDSEIDGDDERFTFEVEAEGRVLGIGTARSKRLAERAAARVALAALAAGPDDEPAASADE